MWPEVLESIRRSGVNLDMQIFLLGRRMFMYTTTTDDYDAARAGRRTWPARGCRSGRTLMRTLQERAPEARPDEWWAEMELVFDMDWPQHRSPTR